MAFTLIITLLPPSRHSVGMAIFALAATIAPSFGPTLGGWLAQHWGWQSIFYVTVAPGAVMIALLWISLERQPMQLHLLREADLLGILSMAVGLGCLQVVLEEAEREDWFDSPMILHLTALASVSLCLFVWRELRAPQPLLDLRLLARRNFMAGATAMLLLGVALFGSVFVQPLYLSRVQGYSSEQIGLVLAWTGLPQFLLIPLIPLLMKKVDPRVLLALGFALFAASNLMLVDMSRDVAADQLMVPNIVRALGQAMVLTPLTTLAIDGIASSDAPSASALLTVMRNLGGAVGIAALQTFLGRREQLHASRLGEAVTLFDEDTRARLDQLVQHFTAHGVADPVHAWRKAVAAIGARVQEQASVMAFADTFHLMGAAMLLALATAVLYRRPMPATAARGGD
jgi:DHA2 family multidrug resistance protein